MTFKIRCPRCQQSYVAPLHWIGKRIRCKKCDHAFVVEQPVDTARLPDVAKHESQPAPTAKTQLSSLEDLAELSSTPRALNPQPSAARVMLEQSVRRASILLAIALGVVFTIRQNHSSPAKIMVLRFALPFALFLSLVLPITYQSVAASFRRFRRKLPASAAARVAAVFGIPASLGFTAWQLYGTPLALIAGLLAPMPVMLGIFWFQFRSGLSETIASYFRACAAFLVGTALAAGFVFGINFVVNRAMINGHAVAYKESPLDGSLPWEAPAPLLVAIANAEGKRSTFKERASSTEIASEPTPAPSALFDLSDATLNPVKPAKASSRAGAPLFANPEDDQFLADLNKNAQPWIKQVSRPEGQSPFDFLVVPDEPSPYVGFVTLNPHSPATRRFGVGLLINSRIRRAESFDITNDANPRVFPHDYLLNREGTLLLHVNGLAVEMISTATHRKETFPLTVPDRAPGDKLLPQLVGLTRDHGVLVRWSNADASEQIVQRYVYTTRQLTDTSEVDDALLATESSAVSVNPTGPIWLASIVVPRQRPLSICLINVGHSHNAFNSAAMPSAVRDLSDYEHVEMAFSPDASQFALLLTDRSRAVVYIWKSNDLSVIPLKAIPPMLSPALASSHAAGPRIRWIDNRALLVDGQAVVSTVAERAGIIGMLSETAAVGAVTIGPDHVLLSYLGMDGSCHLAEVEFDASALRDAAPVK